MQTSNCSLSGQDSSLLDTVINPSILCSTSTGPSTEQTERQTTPPPTESSPFCLTYLPYLGSGKLPDLSQILSQSLSLPLWSVLPAEEPGGAGGSARAQGCALAAVSMASYSAQAAREKCCRLVASTTDTYFSPFIRLEANMVGS